MNVSIRNMETDTFITLFKQSSFFVCDTYFFLRMQTLYQVTDPLYGNRFEF